MAEQLACNAAGSHPRRRLARRRALEDVADVGVAVLERARQVRVSWPQLGHRLRGIALLGSGHLCGPVDVVLVLEHERHRAADGETTAHAADDARDVGLDLLAAAPSVAALTAR